MDRKVFLYLILAAASLLMGPRTAYAERGAQAGLVYGYSVPDAANTAPYVLSGVKGSAFLNPTFSVGGYFLFSDKQGAPSETEKFRYSLHGLEGLYHMASAGGDTYFGLRIGITKVHTNPNGIDTVFSPYHYGVVAGYDIPVLSWLGLGFEASYLHAQRGKTNQNGSSVFLNSFNMMSFMVSLQITR